MHYVIAFDVSDNKVRRHLTKILLGKGIRIQESVFAVNLKTHELKSVARKLEKTLDEKGVIHIFTVCGTCAKKSLAINRQVEYYITD
ncbi:MAG TPA: CRISPR-associated endonuclease Cas2 [Candidatus Syntrophosphaera sp.]|jgi:CRISPR-associated endonuclease Cas2|nr:CRISPR-associated endonuclease Cas2 [Candidatus Cloacimonadota bacterium]HNU53488.1 CRISPR-associated endonuclease Cas2 [Candidatus Syntrophosphaera sp.]HPW38145.1 CRISPR-associated endonuclease Cas2 [Candidatus Syntrophosphaera sp.]HQC46532.1 CRISPR-associated endonuclease Cas2 [Candidatus Syntrophosphaera sp.]HRQ68640.1 CRISPR-associated endonuclease Cas2 [Candidatus Syntrophosphaera sp.]